ncbi:uncharacterized protein LOC112563154 [Pomacea canaliculata]|uniref:uncharacterized protein LOC112563154 n=1 Tax=Pomacea canaliculata TaxID=400727 RepID=UPI000D725D34|nr:uncharacterized protein LOC112563154 [Pomacea canaliculata]
MRQLMILAAALLILCVEMSSCDAEPDAIQEEVLHKPHKRASDGTKTRFGGGIKPGYGVFSGRRLAPDVKSDAIQEEQVLHKPHKRAADPTKTRFGGGIGGSLGRRLAPDEPHPVM